MSYKDATYEGTSLTPEDINLHRLTKEDFSTSADISCKNKYCNVDITNSIKKLRAGGTAPTSDGIWYVPVKFEVEFTMEDGTKVKDHRRSTPN